MTTPIPKRFRFWLFSTTMMVAALTATGCLAAVLGGVAAGSAIGYAYYRGNVYADYRVTVADAWIAAKHALRDLKLEVVDARRAGERGEIIAKTEMNERVTIYLEPTAHLTRDVRTRVHVRVGLMGDYELSRWIHDRISDHLRTGGLPPQPIRPVRHEPPFDRRGAQTPAPPINRIRPEPAHGSEPPIGKGIPGNWQVSPR